MSEREVAGANLNIPKRLYVGTEHHKPFSDTEPPLAFATQADGDSGFAKRKATVDSWVGHNYESKPRLATDGRADYYVRDERGYTVYDKVYIENARAPDYLDNEPLSGFTFEKSVSRWTTSNKWFTINDPRGFQLQIAADNLGDILLNSGVLNGELQGRYVWAKNKNNIFLCRESHPAYKQTFELITRAELELGDICLIGQDKVEWEFVGSFYTLRFGQDHRYRSVKTGILQPVGFSPPYSYSYLGRQEPEYKSQYVHNYDFDNKQSWVFKSKEYGIKVYRSKPTNIKIIREGDLSVELSDAQVTKTISSMDIGRFSLFYTELNDLQRDVAALESDHDNFFKLVKYQPDPSYEYNGKYSK